MKFNWITPGLISLSFMTLNCALAADPAVSPNHTSEGVDWANWRGPRLDGSADSSTKPPTAWSDTENIQWRTPVPGRGHGSPTVDGDNVFLATADKERKLQTVLCFDRATGKQRWEAIVHEGGCDTQKSKKANAKASFASSTIAVDEDRLYINFFNDDAVYTTALDLAGKIVWQQKITDYVIHQGYGSSPLLHGPLVIVSADNKGDGGGAIAGLDRKTGEIVWKHKRPAKPNYASPIVFHLDGRDQLIMTGCDLVTSLDPMTGKLLWEIDGATTECVSTTVTDGKHVYSTGGYPKNHIAAILADGSGTIAWEKTIRQYVPSMLIRDGYLYASLDDGVATCINASTGEEMWKSRLGGTFSSSPVLVGDLIYATNEDGATYIFRASPEKFEKIATNKLGESVFATPAICGGKIYARVAQGKDDKRQEYLVCVGKE